MRVTEAEDGEAALEELNQKPFDVCVLDVRMPKRDGMSVVENLAPEPPPPVIMMASAYDFDSDLRLNRCVLEALVFGSAAELARRLNSCTERPRRQSAHSHAY
jgi:CheY-like chemotaxis protein